MHFVEACDRRLATRGAVAHALVAFGVVEGEVVVPQFEDDVVIPRCEAGER